jgi:hypothetical protein
VPEDIRVNKELEIIEIVSQGKVGYENGKSTLSMLLELIRESGIKKVLADTRGQDFKPSTINIYEFGMLLPRNVMIAVVVSKDQPTARDVSFLDDVAFNRGVTMKLFASRAEALVWLGC